MFRDKRVVVVMPAYNAAETLETTHREVLDQGIVDHVIVVDDASRDETSRIAKGLPHTTVYTHPENRGYGGNQKTCYRYALEHGADRDDRPEEVSVEDPPDRPYQQVQQHADGPGCRGAGVR